MTEFPWPDTKSGLFGMVWPPVLTGLAASLAGLSQHFAIGEWQAPAQRAEKQFAQLARLAVHAAEQSPYFKRRLAAAKLRPQDLAAPAGFARLPLLIRRDLQSAGKDLFCRVVPKGHQPVHMSYSAGSTGEPVGVQRTLLGDLFWLAATLRHYLWHGLNFRDRMSVIRDNIEEYRVVESWGSPAAMLFETGPCQLIPLRADVARQVAWLAGFQPHILYVYPNVLAAIMRHCRERNVALPSLTSIHTISEMLSPRIRQEAEAFFGVKVIDTYSCGEVGVIALQCPQSGLYHVMSEGLLVEVLDEAGAPCAPGETGRVVVTDLNNFATPLFRYVTGDYAEAGPPCPCGRGLPVLAQIHGRERNLVRLPDGSRYWPVFGMEEFWDVAPVRQFQLVQDAMDHVEVRLVTDGPLTGAQEDGLRELIVKGLGYPFALEFRYFKDSVPKTKSGKVEQFICAVPEV